VANMATWRNFAALFFALTAASSRSWAQSQSVVAQPDVVVFWDAAKCVGGYHSDFYSAHCEPGPSTTILDFKTRMQFFCLNSEAVDIRWAIPADAKPGSPIPPSQIDWRPQCWKTRLAFEVDPNATILTPQYSQSPPPNYYMTMNAVVLYDAVKPSIKACLVPLFPRFTVEPACADAEIRF
jgi:hypothetical protein